MDGDPPTSPRHEMRASTWIGSRSGGGMGTWRSDEHREDHFVRHGGPLRLRSVEAYDASADETVTIGTPFTYRDRRTGEWRVGYYHRESARFVAVDLDGVTRSHFVTDAADVANLPLSTYRD